MFFQKNNQPYYSRLTFDVPQNTALTPTFSYRTAYKNHPKGYCLHKTVRHTPLEVRFFVYFRLIPAYADCFKLLRNVVVKFLSFYLLCNIIFNRHVRQAEIVYFFDKLDNMVAVCGFNGR